MKKSTLTIVIIVIIAVIAFLFINLKKVKNPTTVVETTKVETTILETKQTEQVNNTENQSELTKDDLTIKSNDKTTNIVNENNKDFAAYGPNSNAETNRGIKIGDNVEKVWAKYGEVEVSPISRMDVDIYDYLKAHSDIDPKIKDALDSGDMYAKYVYHDDNDGKDYAIGFWFDPENNVKWIFNYTEGLTTENELEEELENELEEENESASK